MKNRLLISMSVSLFVVGLLGFFFGRVVDLTCRAQANRSFERCLEVDPSNIDTCEKMLQALKRNCAG